MLVPQVSARAVGVAADDDVGEVEAGLPAADTRADHVGREHHLERPLVRGEASGGVGGDQLVVVVVDLVIGPSVAFEAHADMIPGRADRNRGGGRAPWGRL